MLRHDATICLYTFNLKLPKELADGLPYDVAMRS